MSLGSRRTASARRTARGGSALGLARARGFAIPRRSLRAPTIASSDDSSEEAPTGPSLLVRGSVVRGVAAPAPLLERPRARQRPPRPMPRLRERAHAASRRATRSASFAAFARAPPPRLLRAALLLARGFLGGGGRHPGVRRRPTPGLLPPGDTAASPSRQHRPRAAPRADARPGRVPARVVRLLPSPSRASFFRRDAATSFRRIRIRLSPPRAPLADVPRGGIVRRPPGGAPVRGRPE